MRPSKRFRWNVLRAAALAALVLSSPPGYAADSTVPQGESQQAVAPEPPYNGTLTGYAGTDIDLIHAGDKLRVEVFREPDLTGLFLVDSMGKINYPLLGEIYVEGLSLEELKAFLTENLGTDYIVNPQIQITFEESPNKSVAILGQVTRPGNYILTSQTTLVQMVSRVGGFEQEAATDNVKIVRTDKVGRKTTDIVNVTAIMSGDAQDVRLEPGDLIYVDRVKLKKEEEEADDIVTILGQVNRPGNYALTEELGLIRLVAQAGGFTGVAAKNNVRLIRKSGGSGEKTRTVNAGRILSGQGEDVPLEKDDLVVVQESFF